MSHSVSIISPQNSTTGGVNCHIIGSSATLNSNVTIASPLSSSNVACQIMNTHVPVSISDGSNNVLSSTSGVLDVNIKSSTITPSINLSKYNGSSVGASNGMHVQPSTSAVFTTNYETSVNGIAIPSGTYTASYSQADQSNTGYKGINIYLNVSAYTDSTIILKLDGKDPVSGTYFNLFSGTAVGATGFHRYTLYPTLAASATVANDVLPATWRILVTVSGATSGATWSVGYDLIR
jgi:hypothetical protein